MSRLTRVFSVGVLLCGLSLGLALTTDETTHALSGTDWKAGNIISDSTFYNNSSMSISDIQTFLNNKVPTCDTWGTKTSEFGGGTRAQYGASRGYPAPFVCLRDYKENPTTHANNLATAGAVDGGWSAAMIIKYAADSYAISPKALLVTIQKESSMITDDWPLSVQYAAIMGYGCPDTGPNNTANCDANYSGFYNQMMLAARQFRLYADNPQNYRYRPLQNNSIYYNPNSGCGASTVYIEGTSTAGLYNYTPYQPNQAALNNLYGTGDGCSAYGNRNFWRMFNDWFGDGKGPTAYRGSSSPTVYLQINGARYVAPSMATIQDYGISPEAIQTLPQATVDSIPTPDQNAGLSSEISHVVKSPSDLDSDGGSIYLISVNRAYKFASMAQFSSFGFSESDIRYIPLNYISSKSQSPLSDYVVAPTGETFEFYLGLKRLILNYDTYIAKNPADKVSFLSYSLLNRVASGKPLSIKPVLIKSPTSSLVYLFQNDEFNSIPSFEIYTCWQFKRTLGDKIIRISNASYVQQITPVNSLSCYIQSTANEKTYLLQTNERVGAPTSLFGTTLGAYQLNNTQESLLSSVPKRSSNLRQFIKAPDSSGIYSIKDGGKKHLNYETYNQLSLSISKIDSVERQLINNLTSNGPYLFDGQKIKSSNSANVYLHSNGERHSFPYASLYEAYGNRWTDIATFSGTDLATHTSAASGVSDIVADKTNEKLYIIAKNGKYLLNDTMQTAFNKSFATVAAGQPYDISIHASLTATEKSATRYIKSYDSSLVYYVENGNRHPVNSYNRLLELNNGTEPTVMSISPAFLDTLTLSSPYN